LSLKVEKNTPAAGPSLQWNERLLRLGSVLFALSLFSTKTGLDTSVWMVSVGALVCVVWERRDVLAVPAVARFLRWSACFLAVAAIASFSSPDPVSSWKRFVILLGYFGVFFAVLLADDRRLRFMGNAMVFACVVECLLAVAQAAGVPWLSRPGSFTAGRRGMGTLGSPNDLGAALGVLIPMLTASSLWRTPSRCSRMITGSALMLVGAGLVATQMRGAWVAVFVALMVMGAIGSHRLLAGVLVGTAIALAVPFIYARVSSTLANPEHTRISYLRTVPRFVSRRPVFGWGLDTFKKVYYAEYPDPRGKEHFHPHNMLLNIAFQVGLVGLLCFVGMLWIPGASAWAAAASPTPTRRWIGWGAVGAMTAFVVIGLFDEPFRAYQAPYLLFAVFGLVLRGDVPATPRRDAVCRSL
jgi:O-antigen ligase